MPKSISKNQKQTDDTFGFKWKKRETYESEAVQSEWRRWLLEKYFDSDSRRIDDLLAGGGRRILDAGCGSGGSALLLFGERLRQNNYLGVDSSESVQTAYDRFAEAAVPARFIRCDLHSIPEDEAPFHVIFSEGVLHHTDSVERAIDSLSRILEPNGFFLFYVYARKAPIREFTDDFIRKQISTLTNDQAWEALMSLTKLGRTLGELNIEIDIEEDIPLLGITRGRQNIQRLFYYKVCKSYYRPDYSLDEMNHINFDWFRPLNCHRHTPDEVIEFCKRANLTIERLHVEESGITVIARK
ncbi:MAG: class I SAM-dependent methyltransferase [Betaproteobacteria bacterium]|nr:class I SAM-dependent methyltransferase [Betaproteobacteria bacterium]